MDLTALPGGDLVTRGLEDLRACGIEVPPGGGSPERELYTRKGPLLRVRPLLAGARQDRARASQGPGGRGACAGGREVQDCRAVEPLRGHRPPAPSLPGGGSEELPAAAGRGYWGQAPLRIG